MVENFVSIIIMKELRSLFYQLKLLSSYSQSFIPFLTKLPFLLIGRSNNSTVADLRVEIDDRDKTKANINVNDISLVIRRFGMCYDDDVRKEECIGEALQDLFVKEEASLDEIWEAFKVFDLNKDGFIDALELGRVICNLGLLKEGSDVERCRKMIKNFDSNGDGLLDFKDFLKFMETCV